MMKRVIRRVHARVYKGIRVYITVCIYCLIYPSLEDIHDEFNLRLFQKNNTHHSTSYNIYTLSCIRSITQFSICIPTEFGAPTWMGMHDYAV